MQVVGVVAKIPKYYSMDKEAPRPIFFMFRSRQLVSPHRTCLIQLFERMRNLSKLSKRR